MTPSYLTFQDAAAGLEGEFKDTAAALRHADARARGARDGRRDHAALRGGRPRGHPRPRRDARRGGSPTSSRARGREVAPRGHTTLVAWTDEDDEATRDRLAGEGVIIRNLPGRNLLRASIGAWNDESDLERLLDRI